MPSETTAADPAVPAPSAWVLLAVLTLITGLVVAMGIGLAAALPYLWAARRYPSDRTAVQARLAGAA